MKKATIGVLGLGLFGSSVARTLSHNNVDVIAMDQNMDHVEEILEDVEVAVQGDFTKLDHLVEAGFGDCDEVIIASAEKLEDTILAILNLKRLEIPHITAKAKNEDYREVLLKVGADRVILPEVEMGVQVATMLANPTVYELIQLDDRYNIMEFVARDEWVGKSISEIDLRKNFNANIIAIRPEHTHEFDIEFGPESTINEGDLFIAVTTDSGMRKILNTR